MAKDFLQELEKTYTIPSTIAISSGSDSIDIRDTCDTVEDFKSIAEMGMELRYDGLVTYEKDNKRLMVCKQVGDNFEWEVVGAGSGGSGENGKSAYEIAVANGFSGSEQEWLTSLRGAQGPEGAPGRAFTYSDFTPQQLAGLKGEQGIPGERGTFDATTEFSQLTTANKTVIGSINEIDGTSVKAMDFDEATEEVSPGVLQRVENLSSQVTELIGKIEEGKGIFFEDIEENETFSLSINSDASEEEDVEATNKPIPVIDVDINSYDNGVLRNKQEGYTFSFVNYVNNVVKKDDCLYISNKAYATTPYVTKNEGTIFWEIEFTHLPPTNVYGRVFRTNLDIPSAYTNKNENNLQIKVHGSGSSSIRCNIDLTRLGSKFKFAVTWKEGVIKFYLNGELESTAQAPLNYSASNVLSIGDNDNKGYNIDFNLFAFKVYEQELQEDEIRGL